MNEEEDSFKKVDTGKAPSKEPLALGGRLAGLSLPRQVLALALWPFLQNMMGVGVGMSDMMIAGRMYEGKGAVAIMDMMGASLYLMWLLMILQSAMATGALALVSRSTGARDMKSANLALGQSLLLGVISGSVSGVLIWLLVPSMAYFFGLSSLATQYVTEYMRVAALLAPFSGVLFVVSSCFRGYGDTVKPFVAMLLVNVVNVFVSIWLVYKMNWGVKGLATGTVVGWTVGALFILCFLLPRKKSSKKKEEPLVLKLKNLRYDVPMLRRVWRVSWPSMIEIIGMWTVNAVGVYLIGTMKTGTLGAHAMVLRLESISFMPGFAIGMAASTLTGQYLGAGDLEMAKKAIRFCWKVAVLAMGSAGIIISVFNVEFLSLFGNIPHEQMVMAAPAVRFVGLYQAFNATMMVMKMSMRGAGATRMVTVYSFISMGLIRVVLLWSAMHWFHLSLLGAWMVMSLDIIVQALLFLYLHFKGDWMKIEV